MFLVSGKLRETQKIETTQNSGNTIILLGILVVFWELLFCLRTFFMLSLKGTPPSPPRRVRPGFPPSSVGRSGGHSLTRSWGSEDTRLPDQSPLSLNTTSCLFLPWPCGWTTQDSSHAGQERDLEPGVHSSTPGLP